MFEPTILLSTLYKALAAGGIVIMSTYSGRKLILRTAIEFDDGYRDFCEAQDKLVDDAIAAGKKGKEFRKITREVKKAKSAEKARLIQLKLSERGIVAMLRRMRKAGQDNAADVVAKFAKKHGVNVKAQTEPEKKAEPAKTADSTEKKEPEKKAEPAKTAESTEKKEPAKKPAPAKKTSTKKKKAAGTGKPAGATA